MENGRTLKVYQILKRAFLAKRKRNPLYSQRALARDLGTSPVFVTKILTGKKSVPSSRLKKLFKVLDMDITMQTEVMRASLLESVPQADLKSLMKLSEKNSAFSTYHREELKTFGVLKHWYNVAIWNYVTCELDDSVKSIADYFSMSEKAVAQALRELAADGLIENSNGRWRKTAEKNHFSTTKSREEVRAFHRQMLAKAEQEMTTKTSERDFERRLICGFTLAVAPDKVETAKKMMADALADISEVLSDGVCQEVYQLNLQLFPLGSKK